MKKHNAVALVAATVALGGILSSTAACSGSPRSPLAPAFTPAPVPERFFVGLDIKGPVDLGPNEGATQLSAIATDREDGTMDVTTVAEWSSSDESVATVTAGLVTAVGPGEATISARFDSLYADHKLAVRMRAPEEGASIR